MTSTPVNDWTSDYDILDPDYVADPYPVWDDLRESVRSRTPTGGVARGCRRATPTSSPSPTTCPTSAHGTSACSRSRSRIDHPQRSRSPCHPSTPTHPMHTWIRRLLLPWFSHNRVAEYEPFTRELCGSLIDGFTDRGTADAAGEYAQQIPARVISLVLGVPGEMTDTFTGWVRDVLEFAHDEVRQARGRDGIVAYLLEKMEERRAEPGDDLISALLGTEVEGEPIPDLQIMGMAALTLIAGVDTTWSAIGSSLWHLATHPADARRLVDEPELLPTAVEELLRAYSPVTMARIAVNDIEVAGLPDQGRRQGAHELPGGEPRPAGVRATRRGADRPRRQPARRVRCRHPSLCRFQPRPHGAAGRDRGVAAPDPRVPPRRRCRGDVGGRSGARPAHSSRSCSDAQASGVTVRGPTAALSRFVDSNAGARRTPHRRGRRRRRGTTRNGRR